jgi:hypothetical protein
MVHYKISKLFTLTSLLSFSAMAVTLLPYHPAKAQTIRVIPENGSSESEDATLEELPGADTTLEEVPAVDDDLRPLAQDGSILSIPGGQRLMSEASSAVAEGDYNTAVERLQEARQVFNQLSNFYQQLSNSFSGIDNRIAENQRRLALETAQMRDQATYQLALVHRAQNKPELAVPLLIQIVTSQQPTRNLGQQAYRQLFELGFVDSPYPRNQEGEPTSTAPSSTSPPLN